MKQLFTMLMIWAVVACIIVTTCKAQPKANDYDNVVIKDITKHGYIQANIIVLEDNRGFTDNNTIVNVDCITDKLCYNDTSNAFTMVLHPEKEYILSFMRTGCIEKRIYISTQGVSQSNWYNIDLKVNLEKGKTPEFIGLAGKLIYSKYDNNFHKELIARK